MRAGQDQCCQSIARSRASSISCRDPSAAVLLFSMVNMPWPLSSRHVPKLAACGGASPNRRGHVYTGRAPSPDTFGAEPPAIRSCRRPIADLRD